MVVKVEWGNKRTCLSCTERFYDLRKSPIICPKCGSVHEIQVSGRKRRGSAADAKAALLGVDETGLVDDLDLPDALGDDLEDEGLIEDTSDLGEDLDDMTEVMEHVVEEDER